MSLGTLIAAIDELVAEGPAAFCDRDVIVELKRQVARLEAVDALATDAFDMSGAWGGDLARSSIYWLAAKTNQAKPTLNRQLTFGRAMRRLPAAAEAWLSGNLTGDHMAVLVNACNPRTVDAMGDDEAMLVGQAKTLWFSQFAKAVRYWSAVNDADGCEADHDKHVNDRRASLSQTLNGRWYGQMSFDAISGAIIDKVLRDIEQDLFVDDWADAKARLGRDPKTDELGRTPTQRRADSVVEMAVRAAGLPEGARKPQPLFTVLVGYETFHGPICELANGAVVTPGALASWITQADIERVVFDAPSRVVDVGVHQRLFTGATRRAIEVRDRRCYHPYCDVNADKCQVDHIIPWSHGGPTTLANGRLACGFHNRARNTNPPPRDGPDDP